MSAASSEVPQPAAAVPRGPWVGPPRRERRRLLLNLRGSESVSPAAQTEKVVASFSLIGAFQTYMSHS